MSPLAPDAEAVLRYWFGAPPLVPQRDLWWRGGPEADGEIRERFGHLVEEALAGGLEDWAGSPRGCVALVLTLDQFPRHVHRGEARAFAGDPRALATAMACIDAGWERELHVLERAFLYMPFEHAESRAMQRLAVTLFAELAADAPPELRDEFESNVRFAEDHREIVERFGRFPHRNACLGRADTDDEAAWLADSPRRFGQ